MGKEKGRLKSLSSTKLIAMTVRDILKMGGPHPLLAQPVQAFGTTDLQSLIVNLFDTMAAVNGAGLAAPQIGVDLQVVILGFDQNERYPDEPPVPRTMLIKPAITPLDVDMTDGWERCLSVPCLRGVVPRHARIRYAGFDPEGHTIDLEAERSHARMVRHECDHLIGRLYPTRIADLPKLGFTSVPYPDLDPASDD